MSDEFDLETYLAEIGRWNLPIKALEAKLVGPWYDVYRADGSDIHLDSAISGPYTWCKTRTRGLWYCEGHSHGITYHFTDRNDAVQFKLIYGRGRKPKRRLP